MERLVKTADVERAIGTLVARMRRCAAGGTWNGKGLDRYFNRCRHDWFPLGLQAIYTRDVGYHTSGWWKNPDFERCLHLSLSFFDPETRERAPRNATITGLIVDALFGHNKRWIWCEPPYSDDGKKGDVWHYRLFCDPAWEPIMPRGEVYSRELTEAGWKSFSDVQYEKSTRMKDVLNLEGFVYARCESNT